MEVGQKEHWLSIEQPPGPGLACYVPKKGMALIKLPNLSVPHSPCLHNGAPLAGEGWRKSVRAPMCAKVAVGMWQRAGSQSVIWAHISHFLYCDSVTLCLAWGLPGLRWVLSECSFPSSTPLLATPLCWPTLFILKALRIPNIGT